MNSAALNKQDASIDWREIMDEYCRNIFSSFDPVTGAAWERVLMETAEEGAFADGRVPEKHSEIAVLVLHTLAVLTEKIHEGHYRNEADQMRRSVTDAMSFRLDDRLVNAIDFEVAITALAQHDRDALDCILMKYIYGYSLSEIATAIDTTMQKVRTRIKKGQQIMLKRLGPVREKGMAR